MHISEYIKKPKLLADLPNALRRNFSLTFAHSLVRRHETDQYIISYPRSGSTWLRTILAGIIDPNSGFEPAVFNRIIPGISGRRLPIIWSLPDPRIIHSHTVYRTGIAKAIYVVRDGRDAIVSHYHYTTTRNGVCMPFNEWFDLYSRRWYGPRWSDHVEGWMTRGRECLAENLMVVKFEDLKADSARYVHDVAVFLGLPSSPEVVVHAIEMAKIERARERERRAFGDLGNADQSFYRGGQTGQYEDYFKGRIYEKFVNMSSRAMALVGYKS